MQFIGQRLLLGSAHNAVALYLYQRLHRVGAACGGGRGCAGDALHVALGVACDAEQGVNDPVGGAVAAVDGHGDRVHQEGHVVVDDLHNGVVADKSVLCQCRVENVDLGRVDGARGVQQTPVGFGAGK